MTNSGHNPIPDANGDGGAGGGGGVSGGVGGCIAGGGNIPIDRVEWSRNTILEFIEDYRGYRVLWDPNTKGYHIKQIKYEALKKLSRKYSTEVRIIRSKIKSLRSSFHREHGKVISGKRRGINYQPMWFAYEAIRFILDGERAEMGGSAGFDGAREVVAGSGNAAATAVVASTVAVAAGAGAGADTASAGIDANDEMVTLGDQIDDQQYANISADDVKTEILETSNGEVEDLKSSIQHVEFDKLFRKRKQRSSRELTADNGAASGQNAQRTDSESEDPQNSPSKSSRQTEPNTLDEFGVFGEYVGITIRKLKTSKAQVVIKHLINNLLYDAEMGRYDFGIPTSRDPPHLYATTD